MKKFKRLSKSSKTGEHITFAEVEDLLYQSELGKELLNEEKYKRLFKKDIATAGQIGLKNNSPYAIDIYVFENKETKEKYSAVITEKIDTEWISNEWPEMSIIAGDENTVLAMNEIHGIEINTWLDDLSDAAKQNEKVERGL